MSVLPAKGTYCTFQAEEMTRAIKTVIPSANKVTNQIVFQFNGLIKLTAEDKDFSYHSETSVPYMAIKTVPDFYIGINGKFMLSALDLFKKQTTVLYSTGSPEKGVILSNGTEDILIMPLHL